MFTRNGEILDPDKSFVVNEITYPGKWLLEATDDQLRYLGISRVQDPPICDSRFYWGVDQNNYCIPKRHGDLVSQWQTTTFQTANQLLNPTDWVIIESLDNSTSADPAITAWRQAVRDASHAKAQKIADTYDTYQLQVYVTGSDYNTWPEQPA